MCEIEDKRILSVAALGRPFRLGMLYDCQTETLIPAMTLWNESTLMNKTVEPLETSEFQVMCSDSLDSKTSALDINPSLKLSYLSGLVDVKGAATYLDNVKTSSHNERITLQYKCTTRVETMTMDQLCPGKIEYPQPFHQNTATHVVTSIVYGAQAFFIFERTRSSKGTQEEISCQTLIERIPGMSLSEEGKVKLTDEEEAKTKEFMCTFIGDFQLEENPSTFIEAIKIYKQLPQILGARGGKAIPFKVTLHPLPLIYPKSTIVFQEISINLMNEIEMFFDEIRELNIKCEDILKSDTLKSFVAIRCQIEDFMTCIKIHTLKVKDKLSVILPRIRGGKEKDISLVDLLQKISNPPFSSQDLRSWLDKKDTQIKVLSQHLSAVSGINFAKTSGDLKSLIMSPGNTYCLCLMISLPSTDDSQLKEMEHYTIQSSNNTVKKLDQVNLARHHHLDETPMKMVAAAFRDFYNANKTKKEISFLMAQEFSEYDDFLARVELYEYGRLINENYELPGCVEKVQLVMESTTHNSVTITWNPPKYGASSILSYIVSWCKDRCIVSAGKNQVTITKLVPNTEYEVQVWPTCDVGNGPVKDAMVLVKTKPASQPKMVKATFVSPTQISLKWNAPSSVGIGCCIEQYVIKQEKEVDQWEEILRTNSNELSCPVENLSNTVANFKIAAFCGKDGFGCDSDLCTIDLAKFNACKTLKRSICDASRKSPNHPHIYIPKLRLIFRNSKDNIEAYEFGQRRFGSTEKIVMLLGATGSGKTTLINGLVNYIFGVDWKDPFRFKMIVEPDEGDQSKSQTNKITSYIIHHQEGFNIPYTLNIIDTPGFGDVRGIERDKAISQNIHRFFTSKENGINNIDAVGFVVNSSLPRLTHTQKYIFDQVLSLFGRDINDNIFLLLTFADGKEPQVLSGIKKADIPHQKSYKFNNSALYVIHNDTHTDTDTDIDEENRTFDHMFWNMGVKSFDNFLKGIKSVHTKSLHQTREVLKERETLQITITGLHQDIRQGLGTLERLKKEIEMLENYDSDIERNKGYEYEVEEEITLKVETPVGHHVTNCLKCNRTCHDDCKIPRDEDKNRCWAMTDGQCRICPLYCVWSLHFNNPYKYVPKLKKVKKTLDELRHRYEAATKQKLNTESLINEIQGEFESLQVKVLGMTHTVRMSIERLEEIALRRNPMSTVGYVKILMETEKNNAEPGWEARLEQLIHVKQEAEYMEQIAKEGFDPFKQYVEMISKRKSKSKFFSISLDDIKKKYYRSGSFRSKPQRSFQSNKYYI